MLARLSLKLQQTYAHSRDFVRTASEVIEEHKSLLWMVGTGSSALAGWAVYCSRRLHYARIEDAMSQITEKIQGIEKVEKEEREDVKRSGVIENVHMVLVLAPAVTSAFLLGYMAGRTQGSYLRHKQHQVSVGLSKNRVYVAVVPERLFEAKVVAHELERAVVEAERPVDTRSRTWGELLRRGSPWGPA